MTKFSELEDDFLNGEVPNPPGISDKERKRRQEVLKQRSGDALKEKWRDEDRKSLSAAIEAVAPPVIVEGKCQVCTSANRVWIERQLMMGRSYQSIANSIPDGPSRKSISNHFRLHMALDQAAVRAILEEHANVINQNYEEGVRGALTHRGMLDVAIEKGFQDMLNNLTTVEPKDFIQMMKLFNELNEGSGTAAVEEAKAAISIFKEALQNVLLKGEGDLVTREAGKVILQGISNEIERLKEENEMETQLNRHLMPGD